MIPSLDKQNQLKERIEYLTGWQVRHPVRCFDETSDPMQLHRGSVLILGEREFVIKTHMREPRFGLDDQIKYWVLSAIDLADGSQRILKTVFDEDFHVHIGILKIRCYRSPDKESAVLDSTRGDTRFMQGETVFDSRGNNVRIIEFIKGRSFFQKVFNLPKSHAEYFEEDIPDILWNLKGSIEAIKLLHDEGFCHGDIRNDHIFIDSETGDYRWIDFDLSQDVKDFDLWSIGNIINYAVAKGIITFKQALKADQFKGAIRNSITIEDGSAFYEYRIMNLGKLYPYIPKRLNDILLHFTVKPQRYYNTIQELLDDYTEMLEQDFPRNNI